jgi:hypothetical protein
LSALSGFLGCGPTTRNSSATPFLLQNYETQGRPPLCSQSRSAATLTQETHWAVCPLSEFGKKLCVPYLVVSVLAPKSEPSPCVPFESAEWFPWLLPNNQKLLGNSLPSSKLRDPGAPAPVFAESQRCNSDSGNPPGSVPAIRVWEEALRPTCSWRCPVCCICPLLGESSKSRPV